MTSKIKVDTIEEKTSAGGVTIDSLLIKDGGCSVLDNKPAVLVTNSSNQSISNSTHTQITYDTETIDTDSAFASNTFTVPSGEGGMYWIYSHGAMQGIDSGEFIQLRMHINDSASSFYDNRMTSHATDTEMKYGGGGAFNLSAGDTVKFFVFQNSGDAQNLTNAVGYIYKLGT